MESFDEGLEGVVVGTTRISLVAGDAGELSYRGVPIEALVERPFAAVAWLLLFGEWPSARQESQLARFLLAHRPLGPDERKLLAAVPPGTHPMLMLQALVPLLDLTPTAPLDVPAGGELARQGLVIAARLPSLVAAYYRREQGLDWPVSCHGLSHHGGFLKAFHGALPVAADVAVLDKVQIMQMEHSFNAGTFAGRVTLSTEAPLVSSIATSLGTLFGRLHGGADQAALEFAEKVSSPANAPRAVREVLAAGGRIMGMGHREYRTVDPRATLLKPLARQVCQSGDDARILDTLEAIEAACIAQLEKPGRSIRANVEFYKGAVFRALGIPSRYFTCLFAMARVFGYVAHALEYTPQARLIRPRAAYTGNAPGVRT
jgi:citrate synthase